LNPRPSGYESDALTTWATSPNLIIQTGAAVLGLLGQQVGCKINQLAP